MPKKFSADKHLGSPPSRRRGSRTPQSAGHALDRLLQRNPEWIKKNAQAAENRDVVSVLKALLPAELAGRARSAAVERTVLVVTADAAVWCGRLRYAIDPLLPELQKHWPQLQTVRLRVAPAQPPA